MKKQYYLMINGERVDVTEEVYRAYMRPIWREERNKRNRWRCRGGKGVRCKKDCSQCEVMRLMGGAIGNDLSLDALVEQEAECLSDTYDPVEEAILNEQLEALRKAILELDKEDRRFVNLLLSGMKEKDAAKLVGISTRMFTHRKKSIIKKLQKILIKFM